MRLVFLLALLLATPVSASVDLVKMIETIRLVENSETPGRAGEQGPWQILPSVWRQYSREHISWASSKRADCVAEQKRVVTAHIAWIRKSLVDAGFADTPKNIALVWCAGFETVRRGKATRAKKDYATRAQNIYGSLP
jgi:hypothetical protein